MVGIKNIKNLCAKITCDHSGNIVYDGVEGGLGFLWRKMHCEFCGKKFTSLTASSTLMNDTHEKGQVLTKSDCDFFDSEIK